MIIISIYATNLIILSSIMIIFDIINLFINLILTKITKILKSKYGGKI